MHSIPIIRQYQTTDQTAPWEGVVFTHEVGSDELAEALKASFPRYRTLRERKHAAIIAFFTSELSDMQSSIAHQVSAKTPPTSSEHTNTREDAYHGPGSQKLPSAPHSPTSPGQFAAPQVVHQRCAATSMSMSQPSFIDPTTATHSSQFVFNAIDGQTLQQKTKRKMTAEEKLEYKETRRRGACSECKRQKGKVCILKWWYGRPMLILCAVYAYDQC